MTGAAILPTIAPARAHSGSERVFKSLSVDTGAETGHTELLTSIYLAIAEIKAAADPKGIEEMFPLRCSAEELGGFMDRSKAVASGWIGFYWGKTPEEYGQSKTIADAITVSWLELFQKKGKTIRQ